MRFLDELLGRNTADEEQSTGQEEGTATVEIREAPELGHCGTVEFRGERHSMLDVAFSPNDEYVALFRHQSPVFLFHGDELQFAGAVERPNAAAVVDDGTVAVVEWMSREETNGTLHVFDSEGETVLKEVFDANLEPVAITPDGQYVATATFNPDCSTYIFDTVAGERRTRHENLQGNKLNLVFDQEDGDWVLYLSDSRDGDPLYGIDLDGEVIWRSPAFEQAQRKGQLLSKDHDPSTSQRR